MVFGHRISHPVVDHATGRVAVTAQTMASPFRGGGPTTPFLVLVSISHTCARRCGSKAPLVDGGRFRAQYLVPPPARTMPSTCSTSSWSLTAEGR